MAKILFAGAAGEVTGSRHLLEINGKKLLLDCGLFQGHRKDAEAKNLQFAFDPRTVDAVILSHAHLDHSGNLPHLVAGGFKGTIFATEATAEMSQLLLEDSAHIQESDASFYNKKHPDDPIKPLYTLEQAQACQGLFKGLPYGQAFEPLPGIQAKFHEAGHILGSAQLSLDWTEGGNAGSLFFSGDLGRKDMPLLKDPFSPVAAARTVLVESTYGDRVHGDIHGSKEKLAEAINRAAARGGKILIPAFAVGRTQEIVYQLEELHQAGKLPQIPIYVDSPLADRITRLFSKYRGLLDGEFQEFARKSDPFGNGFVRYTHSVDESKLLNTSPLPAVIVAGSGMCESGRITHHLRQHLDDPRTAVLIVGYQAEGTLGRHLVEKKKTVKIFGFPVEVRAEIVKLNEYSAHADQNDILTWLKGFSRAPDRLCLVHGEPKVSGVLKERILKDTRIEAHCPVYGETLGL